MSLLAQLKILVVDDAMTSRLLLRDALEDLGFRQINVAVDGEQARKMMMTAPSHLIISDYNMPNMDGLQLLKAIRECKPLRRTPFIIVTGNADRKVLEDGAKLGLNNYLTKPFTPEDLRRSLEAIIGRLY